MTNKWPGLYICVFFLISKLTYAGCSAINIIITNASPVLCELKRSDIKHGYFDLISSAPVYIPANTTAAPIILTQSFFGSELTLAYECGNDRKVIFTTQHHYHPFKAGLVSGTVDDITNMKAQYNAKTGNCIWSEHGSIQWLIE